MIYGERAVTVFCRVVVRFSEPSRSTAQKYVRTTSNEKATEGISSTRDARQRYRSGVNTAVSRGRNVLFLGDPAALENASRRVGSRL